MCPCAFDLVSFVVSSPFGLCSKHLDTPSPTIPWHLIAKATGRSSEQCRVKWHSRRRALGVEDPTLEDDRRLLKDIAAQDVDEPLGARLC